MQQHIILLISLIFVVVNGAVIDINNEADIDNIDEGRINGENGWYVPKKDGGFEWMDMEAYKSLQQSYANKQDKNTKEGRLFSKDVDFSLFTKANPDEPQMITDTYKSIQKSNFNPKNPTRFVIHGWLQNDDSNMNEVITKAWLGREDCNMIVVDWARARGEYIQAVMTLPDVGEKIAKIIDYLHEHFNLNFDTLELIGHSLGAHVAGYTAKKIKTGQIYKIVALDAAFPLFSLKDREGRLCDDDATYVEVIHTNGGKLGFLHPLGKADFYVNGGKTQPGCLFDVFGICSHARSISYYAESVENNNFPAVSCPTYNDAVKNKCGSTYSSAKMCSKTNPLFANGTFYVPVNKKKPFGFGEPEL